MKTLSWFLDNPDYFMITAHRGASFEFPENTLMSMAKAIEAGADMIEFDVRNSRENIPVILHDRTIDRTSNGSGEPADHFLAELKSYNFSYYLHFNRRMMPAYDGVEIPTFEEILRAFSDKVAMNIQTYASTPEALAEICRLYKKYDMYDKGYLTIDEKKAELVKAMDPGIQFCITPSNGDRTSVASLDLCRNGFGARFTQPWKVSTRILADIKARGMRANLFYLDDPDKLPLFRTMGLQGILTNKVAAMVKARG